MTSPEHAFTGRPTTIQLPGDGLELKALDWGVADGLTIIFLHGGGLNAHTWDVVCDLLRDSYRCVAIDLRGHGDSDWSPDGDYTLTAHAADLSHALSALAVASPVLVGMSLGGLVAITHAAGGSPAPAGLVVIDTGPDGSRLAGRRRLHAFMGGPDEFASVDEIVDRALAFNPRRDRARLRRTLLNNVRKTPAGSWIWKYDPRIRRPDPTVPDEEVARHWEERRQQLWSAISRLTCPTLVVRGGDSDMFFEEDAERALAALIDGRRVTIPGASHTVQSDRPVELAAAIRAFVGEIGTDRGGSE
jgi:esterase